MAVNNSLQSRSGGKPKFSVAMAISASGSSDG